MTALNSKTQEEVGAWGRGSGGEACIEEEVGGDSRWIATVSLTSY
jgi:hypothetical protein